MLHDVLIERSRRRDHHRTGTAAAAARASGALPRSCDGAGVSGHYHGIERAHVNAQFQRASGDYATDAPITKVPLDLTAFARQISRAVTTDRFRLTGLLRVGLL